MAVNGTTLDAAKRCMFFRKDANGGLHDLYFDLVTIDNRTFYEPVWPGRRLSNGATQRGTFGPPIILPRNMELPTNPSPPEGRGQYGKWFYG